MAGECTDFHNFRDLSLPLGLFSRKFEQALKPSKMANLRAALIVTTLVWPLLVNSVDDFELSAVDKVEDFELSKYNAGNLTNKQYQYPGSSSSTSSVVAEREIKYSHPYWEKFGEFDGTSCAIGKKLKREIVAYKEIVDQILEKATAGYMKGETMKHLAHFTDYFGNRMAGSIGLEKSINFLARQLLNIRTLAGHVYTEDVELPKWQRGAEHLQIISPIKKVLQVKGLGLTIATPPEGLEGEVVVIDSLEDLKQNKNNVGGKILVFNVDFNEAAIVALTGASKGAILGATAVLVRSVTPFSLYSIHASLVIYNEKLKKIPTAAITVEDAELLGRFYKRGKKTILRLNLENTDIATATETTKSSNLLADFEGRDLARDYVVVSAHTDSWDIGHGATSAAGVILTYELARLFDDMKLYPRRTVRAAFFTGTKLGHIGAQTYLDNHEDDLEKRYSIVMSSDLSCLKHKGYIYSGSAAGACVIHEILQLFTDKLGPLSLIHVNGTVSDASYFTQPTAGIGNSPANIPSLTFNGDDGHAYWYEDSYADSVNIFSSNQLDTCLGIQASVAYVLADLTEHIPRY